MVESVKTWFRKNWSLALAGIVVLTGIYSAVGPWLGDSHYWLFVLWYRVFLYFVWGVWIILFIVLVVWVAGNFLSKPVQVRVGAVLLMALSGVIIVAVFAPFYYLYWMVFYRDHVHSARLANQVYYLAFGIDDGYARYYLYGCDSWGWGCNKIDRFDPAGDYSEDPSFSLINPPWKNAPWKEAKLITDSDANLLYVQERNKVIYEYHPPP